MTGFFSWLFNDNIQMDLRGIWLEIWTGLIWLRMRQVTDSWEHGKEHSTSNNIRKLLNAWATVGFPRRAQLSRVSRYQNYVAWNDGMNDELKGT
jgi:hypothetical protein